MPQLIDVENVGFVEVPDEWEPKQIQDALRRQFPTQERRTLMDQMESVRKEQTSPIQELPGVIEESPVPELPSAITKIGRLATDTIPNVSPMALLNPSLSKEGIPVHGIFEPLAPIPAIPPVEQMPPIAHERFLIDYSLPGQIAQRVLGRDEAVQFGRSAANQAGGLLNFAQSQAGAVTTAVGAGPSGLAKRVMSTAFFADMANSLRKQYPEVWAAWGSMSRPEKVNAIVELAATTGLTGMIGLHAAKPNQTVIAAIDKIDTLRENKAFNKAITFVARRTGAEESIAEPGRPLLNRWGTRWSLPKPTAIETSEPILGVAADVSARIDATTTSQVATSRLDQVLNRLKELESKYGPRNTFDPKRGREVADRPFTLEEDKLLAELKELNELSLAETSTPTTGKPPTETVAERAATQTGNVSPVSEVVASEATPSSARTTTTEVTKSQQSSETGSVATVKLDYGKRTVEKREGDLFNFENADDLAFDLGGVPVGEITQSQAASKFGRSYNVGDTIVTQVFKNNSISIDRVVADKTTTTPAKTTPEVALSQATSAPAAKVGELRLLPNTSGDALVLTDLRVPEEAPKGTGSDILTAAKAKADETGVPVVLAAHADTVELQPALNDFYTKNGFVDTGLRDQAGKPIFRYDPKPSTSEGVTPPTHTEVAQSPLPSEGPKPSAVPPAPKPSETAGGTSDAKYNQELEQWKKENLGSGPLSVAERVQLNEYRIIQESKKLSTLSKLIFDNLESREKLTSESRKEAIPNAEEKVQAKEEVTTEPPAPEVIGMGGSVPAESAFKNSAQTATGIKITAIDEQRIRRGEEPLTKLAARSFSKEVWSKMLSEVDNDPGAPRRLVEELSLNPRALNDIDVAKLLYEEATLQYERARITRDIAQAESDAKQFPNRQEDLNILQVRAKEVALELNWMDSVIQYSKSETGRGLAALRYMVKDNYTLDALKFKLRTAKGGEALNAEEIVELTKQAAKAKAVIEALENERASAELRASNAEAARVLAEIKAKAAGDATPNASPYVIGLAERLVAGLDKRADAARARLKARVGQMGAGVDPMIIADLVEIGMSHLGHVGLDFARWSKAMIDDVGDKFTPYLKDVFDKGQKLLEEELSKKTEKVDKPTAEKIKRMVKKMDDAEKKQDIIDKISAKVEKNELDSLHKLVKDLMVVFARQGVKGWRDQLDAVHGVIKDLIPDIDIRETERIMAGEGQFKPTPKDKVSLEVADTRRQLQKIVKIQNVVARQPVPKFGREYPESTAKERWFQKIYNEVAKKFGIVVTDPAKQAKTLLDTKKRYYDNRLIDLRHEIDTKQRIVRKSGIQPTDAELEAKIAEYKQLKAERDALFPKEPLTQEQQIALIEKGLDREIIRLEEAKKNGWKFPAEKERPTSVGIEARQAKLEALRAERDEARGLNEAYKAEQEAKELAKVEARAAEVQRQINEGDVSVKSAPPRKLVGTELEKAREELAQLNKIKQQLRNAAKPKKSPEERALASYRTRLTNQIADGLARIAAGDFEPRVKKPPITLDPATMALKYKLQNIKREIEKGQFDAEMARRSTGMKVLAGTGEVINTARALMTAFDLSAVLRQGGFIVIGNPLRGLKAMPAMFKAANVGGVAKAALPWKLFRRTVNPSKLINREGFKKLWKEMYSEEGQFKVNEEIMSRPNALLYQQARLWLADQNGKLSNMEEAFMTRWADKIPGIGMSERAYVTFLNRLRADSFDAMIEAFKKGRTPSIEEARAIANFINVATGRGFLGENSGVALNHVFFAPRYVLSRFQLLTGEPMWKGSMRTRKLIAWEYAKYLIGIGVIAALGVGAGATIEWDWRSSDFLKLKFGNTRLDPMSGLAQATVLIGRTITREHKTNKGKIIPLVGPKVVRGGPHMLKTWGTFLRSKLAPLPGGIVTGWTGEDIVGNKKTWGDVAINMVTPLTFGDIYKVMLEQDVPLGMAIDLLVWFGMGAQTYDANAKRPK